MASASRRILIAWITAPAMGMAKWASYIAGTFGSISATVSSAVTPWRRKALANRRQRR